ncbi:PLP-dependent aminotransferase family protein [Paraglaciecola aquimarina]|uniref:PLP-dependent aminotransferase family protein n=1 Tax=Paraglaciecola algarum TaxID=3050085 RepID=A0ABS9D949_9ALTE|nr:PLP-dependent aminotransferase family protein [Paraglaciecola sp. G1-23]MCF2948517.1 PLP-dependent aminotransferase family protein [Paraglaciecola sp. G1-23]
MAFKYQELATQIGEDIQQDKLRAGEPLPALRRFATQHNVSLATANKTYEWLQRQGLITVKAQSGFYVKGQVSFTPLSQPKLKSVSIEHDPSNAIFDILQNALTYDRVGLSNGYLDESLRPSTALQRCIKRTAKIANLTANSYGHIQGEYKLRSAIGEFMQQKQCAVSADNILVTNGCLEAVNLVIEQVTIQGDTVAIFTPCYSGLLTALKHKHRKVLEIPCGAQGPDMSHVLQLFKQQAFKTLIFSSTATNPLGFSLSDQNKQQLASLANQYKISIIEDDTFGSLAYSFTPPRPAFSYEHGGYVIYCASFSKDLAPNMRIGWITSTKDMADLQRQKLALNITCNMPCQLAMADYLLTENYQTQIHKVTQTLQQQMATLQSCVLSHFPAGTKVSQPTGGFFLWVELPNKINAMDLYQLAIDENLCFMPGHTFSMSGQYDHCLRLSITQIWDQQLEKAVSNLGKLANTFL